MTAMNPRHHATRLCRLSMIAVALGAPAAGASAADAATLLVDNDGAQCAQAAYASIQPAVEAAQPGDTVKVCPGNYPEEVTVAKPLTLRGDSDAVEALDCYQRNASTLRDLDPTRQAIIDPPGDGYSTALKLAANDIVAAGLVVEGASVAIDASDRYSGYRLEHNLIRLNTLFALDLGSEGTHQSRVDHNCLRENQYGLVSELDDDSLWKVGDGPERDAWNARDLINARIDHNQTFRNGAGCCGVGLEAAGPGRRDDVSFDHNVLRDDWIGIALQNATRSAITDNQIVSSRFYSALLGGANSALEISSNTMHDAGITGIRFAPQQFTDLLTTPSSDVLVTDNDVRGAVAGIYATTAQSLVDSVISNNTTSNNRGNGISLFSSDNLVRGNQSNNNAVAGITAFPGATGNSFEHNSMHGNGWSPGASYPGADARDIDAYLTGSDPQNDWIDNDCDTDLPADVICGVG